jgi:hypothetical protein
MKSLFSIVAFFLVQTFFAQNIYLNKIEKTKDSADKFLYSISSTDISKAEYLGEIEVQGYSSDDAAVFSAIYKKAKEIGGNAIAYKPFESIDNIEKPLDPQHYKLGVYFLSKENFINADENLYLFAGSSNDQKIRINEKDFILQPRSFVKIKMDEGMTYVVSTKKLLGSTIKVKKNVNGEGQYYLISGGKIGGANNNDGTLHIKSGDITGLEKSFGEFLKLIYKPLRF